MTQGVYNLWNIPGLTYINWTWYTIYIHNTDLSEFNTWLKNYWRMGSSPWSFVGYILTDFW